MRNIMLASACVFALASPAFAQKAQPTDGASTQGNVGPGASEGAVKSGAMNHSTSGANNRPSAGGDASTSGAASGAPVNNTGASKEPGAVLKGVNKQ